MLTRDSDVFLDLVDRHEDRQAQGRGYFRKHPPQLGAAQGREGIEVWFISPAGAEATAKKILANRDAAARELGLDEPESSDIMHMLVDVNQQAMMQRSVLLAEEILSATDRPGLPPRRSVKQESFAVLKSIDMPSVLVEGGFLTNSKDAAFVKEAKGRQALAEAVAAGIVSYLKKYPPPAAGERRRRRRRGPPREGGRDPVGDLEKVQHDRRVDPKLQPARRIGRPRCRAGTRDPGNS